MRHIENPGWNFSMLENRTSLTRSYSEQWKRKCVSSSKIPQTLQVRSLIWTFVLEYRPRSIARVYELVLSWATATLHLWFFNMARYGSIPKEHLNLLYVLNIGQVSIFCISISHWVLNWVIITVLHSGRKFRWQYSYIHTVFYDQFSMHILSHWTKPTLDHGLLKLKEGMPGTFKKIQISPFKKYVLKVTKSSKYSFIALAHWGLMTRTPMSFFVINPGVWLMRHQVVIRNTTDLSKTYNNKLK